MSELPSYTTPTPGQTSTLAIVSLVSGILGWTLVPLLGSIVAVVTGHMAKSEIRRSGGQLTGDGLATAGLILGYLAIVLAVIGLCLVIVLPLLGFGGLAICAPFMNNFQ